MPTKLPYEETIRCVQCGYCLPACPTYLTMEKETYSPRGRIHLVQMAAEGKLPLEEIKHPLDTCLGCRACETACPSGVEYGSILEHTRKALYENRSKTESSKRAHRIEEFLFQKIVPNSQRLHITGDLLWCYQKSGLRNVFRKTGMGNLLPESLAAFEKVLPEMSSPLSRRFRPNRFLPKGKGVQIRFRVAFFTGCIMDEVFNKINRLSIELLTMSGCEVHVIREQTCCGALHAHSGRLDEAKQLAKRNIEAFESLDIDYIVNNAGGCGAMLSEYEHLLAGDEAWEDKAKEFVRKSRDISQILVQCDLPPLNRLDETVVYQPSCHMTNVQKVVQEPLTLLKKIPGVALLKTKETPQCCGSAGIYNLINYEDSMEILDIAMEEVQQMMPTTIVTTNPGCLLQMKLGVERKNLSKQIRAVHLIELLAESAGL